MKYCSLLLLFLMFFSSTLLAQEKESATPLPKKNIIKLNTTSILLKAACLQYERLGNKKTSTALNIIVRPKDAFAPIFIETPWYFTQLQLSSISITPSIRYYFFDNAGKGLYGEFYIRYRRDGLSSRTIAGLYRNGEFANTGTENIIMGGTMLGYQFYKRDNITIDLWMLGLGAGLTFFNTTSTFDKRDNFTDMEPETINEYTELLKDTYSETGTVNWNDTKVEYKKNSIIISPRGFGVTVGVRL